VPEFVLGPALNLLQLDPVKVARQAQATHQADVERAVKDIQVSEQAVTPLAPWEDDQDG
jgi:hypothetical protein